MLTSMKSLAATVVLVSCSQAMACELSLVAPAASALKNPVQVHAALAGDTLVTRFSVSTTSLNAKKVLAPGEYPYQFDVAELFVTFSESGFPYHEFEVSPYNQTFQVRIVSARQHQEGVDLGLTSTVELSRSSWIVEMKIPLKPLGWNGDPEKIRGNLYSILGQERQRSFWSVFLPKAAKANFHQPQYFQTLLSCS
jgi:hypothetical protein